MRATKIAAMFALLGLVGCSFIGVRGPTPTSMPDHRRARCTDGYALPVVDTIPAVLGIGLGGFLFAEPARHNDAADSQDMVRLFVGIPSLLIGATYAASAIYGYIAVHGCRNATT